MKLNNWSREEEIGALLKEIPMKRFADKKEITSHFLLVLRLVI